MTERRLIGTVNTLLIIAFVSLFQGLSIYYLYKTEEPDKQTYKAKTIGIYQVFPEPEKFKPNPVLLEEAVIRSKYENVTITYTTIEYDYVGRCFVTAYCPAECGYTGFNYPQGWTTSSGAICHYSSDWDTPTTCAIDRNYFGYGEILLVGDPTDPDNRKVYVTEDTGAFRGMWVDCFVETMDEVRAWNTRYDSVYSVSYNTYTVERKGLYERGIYSLHFGGSPCWFCSGNDCGTVRGARANEQTTQED